MDPTSSPRGARGRRPRQAARLQRLPSLRLTALAIAVAIAVAIAGCDQDGTERRPPAASAQVSVPGVVGLPLSRATCALAERGLRWRLGAGEPVLARPAVPCGGSGVAVAPDPGVVRQRPAAGAEVRPGTVVVLIDRCRRERARSHRPGFGCL